MSLKYGHVLKTIMRTDACIFQCVFVAVLWSSHRCINMLRNSHSHVEKVINLTSKVALVNMWKLFINWGSSSLQPLIRGPSLKTPGLYTAVRKTSSVELSRPGPLSDIRVLDLSRVLAGPYCTMILGDLGAEILKIEHPVGGDDTRSWGPPFLEADDPHNKESCYFVCLNRNKKSICINLKSTKGIQRNRYIKNREPEFSINPTPK